VQHVLLRRGDGSFALVLWQDVSVWDRVGRMSLTSPTTSVNLRLGSAADLRVGSVATGAAGGGTRAAALNVQVPADDTVVVSIG
jgi:hypothetical protein